MSNTRYEDETLECADCAEPFVLTAGEQRFFIEQRGFQLPRRCKACRGAARAGREAAGADTR